MVDKLFHNYGSHGLPKRVSVKESLLILHFHDSCFSGRAKMGYLLGERNMEKYGDGERGRGSWAGHNDEGNACSFERRRVKH